MQAGKCSLSLLVAVSFALVTVGEEHRTLRGFTTAHGRRELALEQTFLAVPDPARAEAIQAQVSEPRQIAFRLLQPGTYSGPTPEHVDQDSSSTDRRVSIGFNAYS